MTIFEYLTYLAHHKTAQQLFDFSQFPDNDPTAQPMSDYKPELHARNGAKWFLRHDALNRGGKKGGHQRVRGIIISVQGRGNRPNGAAWIRAFGVSLDDFVAQLTIDVGHLNVTSARFQISVYFGSEQESHLAMIDQVLEFLATLSRRKYNNG